MEDIPPELIPLLAAGSQNAGRNRPVHEDNPQIDVKTYEELQKIMAATEKDVAAARRFVQAAISEFNAAVRSFPGSLVALIHGYSVLPTLKVTPELEKKPDYWSMQ
jgi:hypothetical protein